MQFKRNSFSNDHYATEFSVAIDMIAQLLVAEDKGCACKDEDMTCGDCWHDARDWVYSVHKERTEI
jgi:hypothetical protein